MEAVRTALRQIYGNPLAFSAPEDPQFLQEVADALGHANELAKADSYHSDVMVTTRKAYSALLNMVVSQLIADTRWFLSETDIRGIHDIYDTKIFRLMMRLSLVLEFGNLYSVFQAEFGEGFDVVNEEE